MDQALSPPRNAARLAHLALTAAVLAVAMQCVGPIFVRRSGFHGVVFAFHRMWIAALIYTAISVLRRTPPTWRALRVAAPGGLWFAFNVATFFLAIGNTSVANATVIGALQPVALMFISRRLFGERIRHADLVCTAIAIGGVALVVFARGGDGTGDRFGDLCAFASMLGYAAYYIASKKARATLGTLEYQTALTIVAAVALGVAAALWGEPLAAPRATSWLWALAMVALPGTGHLLTNFAHAHVRLGVLGILTLLSPVGSTFMAWLVLDESLHGLQVLGMAVVVASLAAIVAASARGQAKPAATATAR